MKVSPAEQVARIVARVEEHREDPRWSGWVALLDRHQERGPCRDPLLCPFCLLARAPAPAQAEVTT